jgi:hypothetical protein
MNCQQFWDVMPELDGEPGADAGEHLIECRSCAGMFAGHRALSSGLRAARVEWREERAPGRLESKLVAAFRGQAGVVSPPRSRRWWMPVLTWSAPAAVLAAAVLFVVAERRPAQPKAEPVPELAGVDWEAALALEDDPNAGEFIPLPNGDRLPPDGRVNIVRVEVPRSAMMALGYSVEAERAAERVQADVVLGSDGLARAVRFLDE